MPRFGPYVLLEKLGAGSTSTAWLAAPVDEPSARRVLKILDASVSSDSEFVARFRHEAEMAVCIDSRHVAAVHDVGSVDGVLYVAIEYLSGWTLGEVLASMAERKVVAPVDAVIDLVSDGLLGLHAIHTAVDPKSGAALDAVHRDISPKNLIVGLDGRMRIIDLGLGRSSLKTWQTKTGQVMGSPGYMAPEQVNAGAVDLRADLYSMGVVLFELLVLERYVPNAPLPEMLRRIGAGAYRAPSSIRPEIPKAMDAIVEKAVALRAADRFSSALELLRALRGVATEGGDRFRPVLLELGLEHVVHDTLPPKEPEPETTKTTAVVFARRDAPATVILPQRASIPWWAIAVIVVIGLQCLVLTVLLLDRPQAEVRTIAPPRAAERVRAQTVEPVPEPEPAVPPVKRAVAPSKAQPVPAPPPPAPPSFAERAKKLRERCRALKARSIAGVDELVVAIALWEKAEDRERAMRELEAIESKVGALER